MWTLGCSIRRYSRVRWCLNRTTANNAVRWSGVCGFHSAGWLLMPLAQPWVCRFFFKVQPFCLGPPHFNGALPTQAHENQHTLLTHTGESSQGSSLLNETWEEQNQMKQVHASKLTFSTRSVQPGSQCELSDSQSVPHIRWGYDNCPAWIWMQGPETLQRFASRTADPAEHLVGNAEHPTATQVAQIPIRMLSHGCLTPLVLFFCSLPD